MSEKKDIMEEVYEFVESSLPAPDITVNVEKRIAKRAVIVYAFVIPCSSANTVVPAPIPARTMFFIPVIISELTIYSPPLTYFLI